MWFKKLTGFDETSSTEVRSNLVLSEETITSKVNGGQYQCGILDVVSLGELRQRIKQVGFQHGQIRVSEVVGDAGELHTKRENAGALFQVASQFNLLEMVSPTITPERGIDGYEHDLTQGPACAIACGAGTIYRNYFAQVNGFTGQTRNNQIDTLKDLGHALGNQNNDLWKMQNGYALASEAGLKRISSILKLGDEKKRDLLRQKLQVGIQWNTQVTKDDCQHLVSQVYGSALPVSYSGHSAQLWSDFAQLVLEASYEATLSAAVLNASKTGNNRAFLTLLGGGAFGNRESWILDALTRSLSIFENTELDVSIVSYGRSNPEIRKWILGL